MVSFLFVHGLHPNPFYHYNKIEKAPVHKVSKSCGQSAGHQPQTRLKLNYHKEPPHVDQNAEDVQ